MTWWRAVVFFIHELAENVYHDPYGNPATLSMNMPPQTPSGTSSTTQSKLIVAPSPPPPANEQTVNGMKLYYKAKSLLTHRFVADDTSDGYGSLACAESINYIASHAIGVVVGGGNSTALMLKVLEDSTRFIEVSAPLPGDIAICATGTSSISPNLHGHVAITGNTWYMSNDSETGTWEANYTRPMWERSFAARGFTTRYFRVI